ncbi:MAG: hypothetical protein QM715_17980 [Nibricoccus sp.]
MPAASEKLHALRDLLARRFPDTIATVQGNRIATGLPSIDSATGGLPTGSITEIICSTPSGGGTLVLARLLEASRQQRLRVALVDGANTFDPQSFTQDALAHLVWVRCHTLSETMQVADLLARDANFGLVLIDVRGLPERELRREPSTSWYRLQRAAEQSGLPLLIETPFALVPSARLRFVLDRSHPIAALEAERPALTTQLAPTVQRQRLQTAAAG